MAVLLLAQSALPRLCSFGVRHWPLARGSEPGAPMWAKNEMRNESNIKRHFRMGPRDKWARAQANSLYHTVFAGMAGAFVFGSVGYFVLPSAIAGLGTFGFVVGVALRVVWLGRRNARLAQKAVQLNAELDALKQKEFELRYEEARKSGAFKQWEKPE